MNEKKEKSNFDIVAHLDIRDVVENVPLYAEKKIMVFLEAPDDAKISVSLGSLKSGEIHFNHLQPIPVEDGTVMLELSTSVLSHQIKNGEIADPEESTK